MKKPFKRDKCKRSKIKRNDLIFLVVCIFVFGGFLCTVFGQEQMLAELRKDQNNYGEEIAAREKELEILEGQEEKNSGDEYWEKKARDEGYVGENDIVFVPGN